MSIFALPGDVEMSPFNSAFLRLPLAVMFIAVLPKLDIVCLSLFEKFLKLATIDAISCPYPCKLMRGKSIVAFSLSVIFCILPRHKSHILSLSIEISSFLSWISSTVPEANSSRSTLLSRFPN